MKLLLIIIATAATAALADDPVSLQALTQWTTQDGKPAPAGWVMEKDGVLHRTAKAGDLYTVKEYADFEFSWEWKIAEGGNSGVKYRIAPYEKRGPIGPEYQLLDDTKHADAKVGPQRQTASLYDFTPPDAALKKLNPPGQWNTSKIVARGTKFEHWLNGVKVLEMDTASEAWKAALAKSKFKGLATFAQNPKGRLMLQDHGDEVWFRNLSIKEL